MGQKTLSSGKGKGLRRLNVIVWLAAVIVITAVVVSFLFYESIALKFFGPPEVTMKEAYAEGQGDQTFDHSLFDALLKARVDRRGRVDYEGLRFDRRQLDAYVAKVAEAPFAELSRDGKLALLLNAYNAFTLELIVDHAPRDTIRQIPSHQRWNAKRWSIGGQKLSLEELEHEWIRSRFAEPRIHFALVCASISCPPLRAEAYVPERLEEQLSDQSQRFHAAETGIEFDEDERKILLNRIYRWYEKDFSQFAATHLDYVATQDARVKKRLGEGRWRLGWLDYDWSLNAQ